MDKCFQTDISSSKMNNSDVLQSRRDRFSKKPNDWGLVSRGEDRLRDPKERLELEKQLNERINTYKDNTSERDSILMGFRKLREGVLSSGSKEEYLHVYLKSAHFAVEHGEPKDYLPILWALSDKNSEFAKSSLALHLAFREGDYERSFQIVNSTEIENAIRAWVCGNAFEAKWWLKKLIGYGRIAAVALEIVETEIVKGVVAFRGKEIESFKNQQLLIWVDKGDVTNKDERKI